MSKPDYSDLNRRMNEGLRLLQYSKPEHAAIASEYRDAYEAMSGRLPRGPFDEESPAQYRLSLIDALKPLTPYARMDFSPVAYAPKELAKFGQRVISEAMKEMGKGPLRQITRYDQVGRESHEFVGSMNSWLGQFKAQPMGYGLLDPTTGRPHRI
ncbi:hypothetical protein [Trinickia mobilis]|uniref:hypothetical protein n=1 Tax=Trinickia mobilis TaxID=2816356 RepID=UPI001A8C1F05|nr:hypothetical protein [Trinickia mobilis]